MIRRALLTGVGAKYAETAGKLEILELDKDLSALAQRLKLKSNETGFNWDSIDVIHDSDTNVAVDKNSVILGNDTMPTKENIFRTIDEILSQTVDVFLFYFSGHGLLTRNLVFYMVNYDQEFFKVFDIKNPSRTKLISGQEYIGLINDKLKSNPNLKVVSIIDCCFSGAIIALFEKANQFIDRHLMFCAVSMYQPARGGKFTTNICQSAAVTDTYAELKTKLEGPFSPAPVDYIPDVFGAVKHDL